MKRAIFWVVALIVIGAVAYYQWQQRELVNLNNRGVQYMMNGEHAKAIELLELAYSKQPKNAKILNNLAECYKNNSQHQTAIEKYEQLKALDARYTAEADAQIKECQGMIEQLSRPAPTPTPAPKPKSKGNFLALMELNRDAMRKMRDGKHDEAIDLLREARRQRPTSEWVLSSLGRCYMEVEKYELAAKTYEKLLELNPKHPEAAKRLKMCQEKLSGGKNGAEKRAPEKAPAAKPDAPAPKKSAENTKEFEDKAEKIAAKLAKRDAKSAAEDEERMRRELKKAHRAFN